MLFFRRDPIKQLKKKYQQKMEAAMQAMHKGDIRKNAELFAEAEAIREEIESLDPLQDGSRTGAS